MCNKLRQKYEYHLCLRFIHLLYWFLVLYLLLGSKTLFVCADDITVVDRKIRDIRNLIVSHIFHFTFSNQIFQVTDFKHLGTDINNKNNTHNERELRI